MKQPKHNNTWWYSPNGFCVAILVLLGMVWGGCDKSTDSEGVDKAQRLARSSGQTINLNDADISQIQNGEVDSKSQETRLAGRIIDRMEGRAAGEFDAALKEIDALKAKLSENNPEIRQELTRSLLNLSRRVQGMDFKLFQQAEQENHRRIKDAMDSVRDLAADQDDNPSANWMLGILHLMQARMSQGQLCQQVADMQNHYITLGRLAEHIKTEQIVADGLKTQLPQDVIAQLKDHLEGAGFGGMPSLREQLAASEKRLAELTTQEATAQQNLDFNQAESQKLRQEYLGLLEEAGKKRGQERFDLEQKAHDVRSEKRQNGDAGLIYYETQTELANDILRVIQSNVRLEQMRREKFMGSIREVTASIDRLNLSEISREIDKGVTESQERLVGQCKSLQESLDQLQNADKQYQTIRLEILGSYNNAKNQFALAGRKWRSESKALARVDNANQMVEHIDDEVSQLWHADAAHFTNAAMIVGTLDSLPEIGPTAKELRTHYDQQAQLAQESAEKLKNANANNDNNPATDKNSPKKRRESKARD